MVKIGIHQSHNSFSDSWIMYCDENHIEYKIVNCYKNDIIEQLRDCDALMWHHDHMNSKDILFAKPLLFALEHTNITTFPNFKSNWHFDDKLGQKYLFEVLNFPIAPTYVFFNKKEALSWTEISKFPKVFKLRRGGASWNVFLVDSKSSAVRIINKAFGKGFKQYKSWHNLRERYRKFKLGKLGIKSLFNGVLRIILEPKYSKVLGRENGYVYFQDFVPNNNFDIRVIVIEDKAFAIKRMVRENDFRASGSGEIIYSKENFDDTTIQLSFSLAKKLKSQCVAFDFVFHNNNPIVVEISYGFTKKGYDDCPGYWDEDLNWYEGPFNPYGWMVENVIKSITMRKKNEA